WALGVQLVEGVEEAARDELREDWVRRIRRVDDELAAVGETKHMDGCAHDVRREVSLRVLELRSRSESSPQRPRGRAPAAPQVEDGEPSAPEDEETRTVECSAEDPGSAESEGPDAAAGREDADRVTVAQNRDPGRIEGGDGRLAAERPDDRLARTARLPDTRPMDAELATALGAGVLDVERERAAIGHDPAEERPCELGCVRPHELARAHPQGIVDGVAVAGVVAPVAHVAGGEQHVVDAAASV